MKWPPQHPFPNLSIIWDATERVCVTVSSQTVVPACTEGMWRRRRRRRLVLSAAPAQYAPLFFFRLSDMHSKWLGQTCASLIRLFTLLLFSPLLLPLPPQSLILVNISTYARSEIFSIRGVQRLRLLCLCSVVSFFFVCVCYINYKNKVIQGTSSIYIECDYYHDKEKNLQNIFFFFLHCLKIYSRLATQCSPSPQVFAQTCNRFPPQTWLSCCIKAEHQWRSTSPFFFFPCSW